MKKLNNLLSSIKVKSQTAFDANNSSETLLFESAPQSRLNLIEYFKTLELEDRLKSLIDYVMNVKTFEQLVYDTDLVYKLDKLNSTVKLKHNKFSSHLFSILDYVKVIEHLISLLQMTQECNRVCLIEHYGRKQDRNIKLHDDHHLVICICANDVYMSLINLIASLTDLSKLFRFTFNQKGGTNFIFHYFYDAEFISDCFIITQIASKETHKIRIFFENKLMIIRNLSRSISFDSNKESAIKAIKTLVNNYKFKNEYDLMAYSLLAKLLNDFEISNLSDLEEITIKLLELTKSTILSLENHEKTIRVEYDFDEVDGKKYEIVKVPKCDYNFNLIDLLIAIFYLNKNDKFRHETFSKYRLSDDLKKIILCGNDVEAEYAILVLLGYTFDERLGPILAMDDVLISIIRKIILYQYPNIKLNKYCECFVWVIDRKYGMLFSNNYSPLNVLGLRTNNNSMHKKSKQIRKIMLNCDVRSRKIAIRIENVLKGSGYKVWYMDEMMQNYSLKKQILALESSDCIVMVMTNDYQLNLTCRVEAEYAFEMDKCIIPIVLSENFYPNQWIRKIINIKNKIDFTQHSVEHSLYILLNQIMNLSEIQGNKIYQQ